MRPIIVCAAASLILLGGCGSKPDPNRRLAGMWSTTATIDKLEFSKLRPGTEGQVERMKAEMRSQMINMFNREECVTEQDSKAEDLAASFLLGPGAHELCDLPTNKVGDGKIEVAGSCMMGRFKLEITMTGTVSPEEVAVVMHMRDPGGPDWPAMDFTSHLVTSRTGRCGG